MRATSGRYHAQIAPSAAVDAPMPCDMPGTPVQTGPAVWSASGALPLWRIFDADVGEDTFAIAALAEMNRISRRAAQRWRSGEC